MAWKYVQYEDGKYRTVESGGGGGSIVSITPTLLSGTKIADFEIDGTPGELYAPSGGSSAHNYSTNEQVVGTWIDGKPLYEKTVDCGNLFNNGTKGIAHNISNIKRIVGHSGGAINSSGTYLPLPKVSPTGLQYCVDIAITTTDIFITTGNDRTDYYAYVTLRYTKTTD